MKNPFLTVNKVKVFEALNALGYKGDQDYALGKFYGFKDQGDDYVGIVIDPVTFEYCELDTMHRERGGWQSCESLMKDIPQPEPKPRGRKRKVV